jgi:hypothetical protein
MRKVALLISLQVFQMMLLLFFLPGSRSAGAVEAPPPSFGFVDPVVAIGAGQTDGTGEVVLRVAGRPCPATLADSVPKPNPLVPGALTIDFLLGPTEAVEGGSLCHFVAKVKDLPANSAQKRSAMFPLGGASRRLVYWLTNRAPAALAISPPVDPWVVHSSRCTALSVNPGDLPVTGLRLLQSTLLEDSSKEPIGLSDLVLCSPGPCQETTPLAFPEGQSNTLSICLKEGFAGSGKYSGKLVLGTARRADFQSIDLKLYKSGTGIRILGFFLICVGIGGSYWLKVAAKSQLDRLQALAPAAFITEQFSALRKRLEALPQGYQDLLKATLTEIDTQVDALSPKKLELFLPPRVPSPFGAPPVESAAYKTFLEGKNAPLASLRELVRGAEAIRVLDLLHPGNQPDVDTALTKIAALSARADDQVHDEVNAILAILKTAVTPSSSQRTSSAFQLSSSRSALSFEQIQVRIEHLSGAVWILWGLLTSLAGLDYLILGNPGFGTLLDLVFCVFWGFGIPTVLTQLTPTAVNTALGVSVVRQ